MSDYPRAAGHRQVLAIANRAEIAIRIARTAHTHGWKPVALLGDPDLHGYAARTIGDVERVGAAGSELDPALVIAAAQRAGATALHPGYGFLSEKPELSTACLITGITFIGPSPETLALCGDKVATREVAERESVPLLPAGEPLDLSNRASWLHSAEQVGFPVIAKVAGGGGGRGLRVADTAEALAPAVDAALREAGSTGGGERIYLERYLRGARHVEVQVAGDGSNAVALGDRDCSIQRRHQKVVEEAPAFGLSDTTRDALHAHAVTMARAVGLLGLATVEFLLGNDETLAFIEINPRLQVEHTVTEEVTGLDLVALQLHLAHGGELPDPPGTRGHAIQARWYAEDPARGFVPSPGEIRALTFPRGGARIDAGYQAGDEVPSAYDPLIAKLITHGPDRRLALDRLETVLNGVRISGIATNRPWLLALLRDETFRAGRHDLSHADTIHAPEAPPPLDALAAVVNKNSSASGASDAWAAAGPYRIIGHAVQAFHGDEAGGWERQVQLHPGEWKVLVSEYDAKNSVPAEMRTGTTVLPVDIGWEVSAPEGRWFVKPGRRPKEHTGERAVDGVVRAPMPGTVAAVHVSAGQRVAKDDVVAVMLAMKIEIALASPVAGVVAAVGCAPGDLVSSRQALVTIQPDAEEEPPRERA